MKLFCTQEKSIAQDLSDVKKKGMHNMFYSWEENVDV